MKNKKLLFNHLVLQYHKSLGKLKRLSERGLNIRKQNILGKRIEKIKQQLLSIKQALQSATAIASIVSAVAVIHPENSIAQNFQPPVVNPFSLNLTSDSIGNIKSVDFADLDADGNFDAVVYKKLLNKFYFVPNIGTPEIPEFGIPEDLGLSIPAMEMYGYWYAQYLDNICLGDLDFDGDYDLMGGANKGNFIYFENIGTDSLPIYNEAIVNPFGLSDVSPLEDIATGNFFQVFDENFIEFVDLDGDGDFDIYTRTKIYNYYYGDGYDGYGSSNTFYKNYYIENTGQQNLPAFATQQLISNNFSGTGDFSDMDSDGDFDYISTIYVSQYLKYFENIGSSTQPNIASYTVNPFSLGLNVDFPLFSPLLADFDSDEDVDLIFLKSPNEFYYYENKTCDSNLTNTISITNNIAVTADQLDAQYQWFYCNTNYITGTTYYNEIEEATSRSYYPLWDWNYIVQISSGDCVISSECYEFISCEGQINDQINFIDGSNLSAAYPEPENIYSWLDCGNGNIPIDGENLLNFYPENSGSYALEIASGGCRDTSYCYSFNICGLFTSEITYDPFNIIAVQENANYAWLDCNNDSLPIEGETNQIFTPTVSGIYSLQVSDSICNKTSDCVEFFVCDDVSSEILVDGYTLYANENFDYYQWNNCDTGNPILYMGNNATYAPTTSGNYSVTIYIGYCYYTSDCIYLNLCDNVTTGINLINNSLIALEESASSYQWIDCNSIFEPIISGETSQTFTPNETGSYAVEIIKDQCTYLSECIDVTVTAIDKITQTNTFTLVPNPSEGKLNITTDKPLQNATIQITSVTGKIIFEQKNVSGFQFDIDLSNHANGLYFLEISENGNVTRKKIVKE